MIGISITYYTCCIHFFIAQRNLNMEETTHLAEWSRVRKVFTKRWKAKSLNKKKGNTETMQIHSPLKNSQQTSFCFSFTSGDRRFLSTFIFLLRWWIIKLIRQRLELKFSVMIPFTRVFGTTPFALVTTARKQGLSYSLKHKGWSIFTIDSEDDCTPPSRNSEYSA